MLNPPSKINNLDEEGILKELDEVDKQNNNYINQSSTKKKYIDNADLSKAVVNNQSDIQIDQSKRKLMFASDVASSQSRLRSISDIKRNFQLGDVIDFVNRGIEVNSYL